MSLDYHTLTQQQRNKKRQRASPHQLNALLRAYSCNPRPDCTEREKIGKQIDMTPRSVQIWFQNMRAKQRLNEKYRGMNGLADDYSGISSHCSASRNRVYLTYSTPPTPLSPKCSGFHKNTNSNRYDSPTAGLITVSPPLTVAADGNVRIVCDSLKIGSWVCNNNRYGSKMDPFTDHDQIDYLWAYVDTVRIVLSFVVRRSTKLYGIDVDLGTMPTASSSTTEEAGNARLVLSIIDPASYLRCRTKQVNDQIWQACPNFIGLPVEECETVQILGPTNQILAAQSLIDSVISQQHRRQSATAAAAAKFVPIMVEPATPVQEELKTVPYELDNDISQWLLNLDSTTTESEIFTGENLPAKVYEEQPDSSLSADRLVECRDQADRVTSRLSQQLKAGLNFQFDDDDDDINNNECDANAATSATFVSESNIAPELEFMEESCDEFAQLHPSFDYDYVSSIVGDDSSSVYDSVSSEFDAPAHYLSRSQSVSSLARKRIPRSLSLSSVPHSLNHHSHHQPLSPGLSHSTVGCLPRPMRPHEVGLGSPFTANSRAFSSAAESSVAHHELNWDSPSNELDFHTHSGPATNEHANESVFDMLLCDEMLDN